MSQVYYKVDEEVQIAIDCPLSPPPELRLNTEFNDRHSGSNRQLLPQRRTSSSNRPQLSTSTGNVSSPPVPRKITRVNIDGPSPSPSLFDSNTDPVTLTFENLSYFIPIEGAKDVCKTLLSKVSGVVLPGQVLAIMGPSGSGKTTLLDVLSGRANRGRLSPDSSILINGKERFFKKISGYVMQDDSLIGSLTVEEALTYTAELRLPRSLPAHAKRRRVSEIINQLGLSKVRYSRIGSQFQRGLSGGERRRVSIGIELLTGCRLLFLDEPTSGLDGASAFTVTQSLSHIAKNYNRTIVCTIHQPRSSTFKSFDLLLLLNEGQVIYFGNPVGAIQYFGDLGYQCDSFTNPADFLLTDTPDCEESNEGAVANSKIALRKELPEKYSNSELKKLLRNELDQIYDHYQVQETGNSGYFTKFRKFGKNLAAFGESEYAVPGWKQFWVLMQRSFVTLVRTPAILRVRMFQAVAMAALVGSIYYQVGNSQSDIQRRTGAIFFVCIYQTLSAVSALATFIEERGRFNRERLSGSYSTFAYFMAASFAQVPVLLSVSVTFGSIVYWLVGFRRDLESFGIFLLMETLLCFVGDSICLLVSAAVGLLSVANSIASLCITFFLLFGGFFLPKDELPIYWQWANYVSPFKYAYEALMINEFSDLTFTCDSSQMNPNTDQCLVPDGKTVLENSGIKDTFTIRQDVLIVAGMFLTLRIFVYFALRFLNKEKR